ncbi:class I SAM-dependent methyltransferase [Streptomyces phaeofaciens JCM 4814]|uniref:Methyltransferase n=1 Tax=Streptomyces phaeofaciens TaxID=68254 RepID=A0A918H3U0_9ACTN|nr:class I SAM-dependent methyltransferase [Streptomyces phaeofaciens]GGT36578.1 methyltransferase [Streptomyces phaeofaciens]
MVDHSFADLALAALYDTINPWGPDDDFYLDLVRSAGSVLDVGCGTGRLLARAAADGHPGRLTGLDPAAAMLVQARRRAPGVEWVLGDLRCHRWQGDFELVVMTGHAFQTLLDDEELRTALRAVRSALGTDGRFVFETRNPAARAWEGWTPDRVHEVTDADGRTVRVWQEVEGAGAGAGAGAGPAGDRVTFTETYDHTEWPRPRSSRATLRFLSPARLTGFLAEAGLRVAERYGDWDRGPLTETSPEIITVATPDR